MPRYELPRLDEERLHKILSEHPSFSNKLVPVTATTITLSAEKHSDRTVVINHAGGVTATLPKASGTGDRYRIVVGTLATANNHIIKVGSTADAMVGSIWLADTDTAGTTTAFSTASTSDTITMNRSTTGSVTKGEFVELTDMENNTWQVSGWLSNTGTAITPFSSTVN